MAQEKCERRGKSGSGSRRQSESQMSLSDQETRTKATIKDIEELYSALQDLVPKPGKQEKQKARGRTSGTSGTDTDTTKDCEDSERSQRQYSNGRNRNRTAGNMKSLEMILDKESNEKRVIRIVSLNDRMFSSDTELDISSSSERNRRLQRCASLPAYDDEESANEMVDGNDETAHKRSLFLLFRRRHPRPTTVVKEHKQKRPSWRTLLATLSFKQKLTKNRKKNKSSQDVLSRKPEPASHGSPRQSREKTISSTHNERAQKTTQDVLVPAIEINANTIRTKSFKKSKAPEHPAQGNLSNLETRSDEVTRKLSAWYKHVVKETTSLNTPVPALRYSRSCESLLTDSEILRVRGSSDTESAGANDIRSKVNMNRIRVRKSRAMRNRRKERARWWSLPNVKLVSYALDMTNKKAGREMSTGNDDDKEKEPTEVSNDENLQRLPTKYTTTVKPVEAKLSFGSTLEKEKTTESPMKDFMMIQRETSSSWLSQQCSKTTISCIRPLQLNLFYSESPSREAIFRCEKPKFQFKGSKPSNETTPQQGPVASALRVRRTSSIQRRRKRRSFKRQARLPLQSPFYLPENDTSSSPTKFRFNFSNQDKALAAEADKSPLSCKDSGLGSPDLHEEKVFRVEAINTSERRRVSKLYWESEDSGWASMDKSTASHADTAMQTEPVIVMTISSKARGSRSLPQLHNDSDSQSEA